LCPCEEIDIDEETYGPNAAITFALRLIFIPI
jgi:hypothetical protein